MAKRFDPGDLITADIINDILDRLEKLEALVGKPPKGDKEKDTKESKEKDTKETKEKDTKETKEKDTKETKEKDSKETKEKDNKETKDKDSKEGKDTKDTKEVSKENKENKESKESKENKEEKQEKENPNEVIPAPFGLNPFFTLGLTAADDPGDESAETITPSGRAFILESERPPVGRMALELADDSGESDGADKPADIGKPVDTGKPGEVSDKQAEAIN